MKTYKIEEWKIIKKYKIEKIIINNDEEITWNFTISTSNEFIRLTGTEENYRKDSEEEKERKKEKLEDMKKRRIWFFTTRNGEYATLYIPTTIKKIETIKNIKNWEKKTSKFYKEKRTIWKNNFIKIEKRGNSFLTKKGKQLTILRKELSEIDYNLGNIYLNKIAELKKTFCKKNKLNK